MGVPFEILAHGFTLIVVATVLVILSITNTLSPTAVSVLLAAAGISGIGITKSAKNAPEATPAPQTVPPVPAADNATHAHV